MYCIRSSLNQQITRFSLHYLNLLLHSEHAGRWNKNKGWIQLNRVLVGRQRVRLWNKRFETSQIGHRVATVRHCCNISSNEAVLPGHNDAMPRKLVTRFGVIQQQRSIMKDLMNTITPIPENVKSEVWPSKICLKAEVFWKNELEMQENSKVSNST